MVSMWPWKGDNTSPASFEKALSALSTKITASSTKLEGQRQSKRRFKGLWTLYTSMAYLLYVMVVVLVVGWQNVGVAEYTALSGAPVGIYIGRLLLETYYNYRISSLQTHVNALQKQRDGTITKLKAATKYDSTQQLLEKYGGTPSKPRAKSQDKGKAQGQQKPQQLPAKTTGFAPPPTANIPRQPPPPNASIPQQHSGPDPRNLANSMPSLGSSPQQRQLPPQESHADFAPNAFPAQQYAQDGGHKWYDRLMDVLLGEDESNAKNRLALICKQCRLVNGQAPPGVRSLEDVGEWRCSACGTTNGAQNETKKLMAELRQEARGGMPSEPSSPATGMPALEEDEEDAVKEEDSGSSDVTQYSDEDQGDTIVVESNKSPEAMQEGLETPPVKRGRGRPKGSTKKKA